MIALSNYHPKYTGNFAYNFFDIGKIVHEVDLEPAYETDMAMLLKKGKRYILIQATGCSCWDGDWEGWQELTKPELKNLAKSWASPASYNHADKVLGQWILDNWKQI